MELDAHSEGIFQNASWGVKKIREKEEVQRIEIEDTTHV